MRDRLLSSLHSVFDKEPAPAVAMRLQHPLGLAWKVEKRKLTLSTEAGALLGVLPLAGISIGLLAQQIGALGAVVADLNPSLTSRLADALLDGSGRQSESNGDRLMVYDSLLWAILDTLASELEAAQSNAIIEGLKQAYLHTAEDEWLDYWAGHFGMARSVGEDDEHFLLRILVDLLRPRNNPYDIRNQIKEQTGIDIVIREMWDEIFMLNGSTLSGGDCIHDGNFYTWGVIQPIVYEAITAEQREKITEIVERNRTAGVYAAKLSEEAPFVIRRDIDFSNLFDQQQVPATWKDLLSWHGSWKAKLWVGGTVSMGIY